MVMKPIMVSLFLILGLRISPKHLSSSDSSFLRLQMVFFCTGIGSTIALSSRYQISFAC